MNRILVRAACLTAPALLLFLAGCGNRGPAFNDKVEGTLTVDGAPLGQAMVQFVPDPQPGVDAPPSTGLTDANGRFLLMHDRNKPGAAVGKHHVVILQGRAEANPDDPAAPAVPAQTAPKLPQVYTMAGRTPLQVEVTADRHIYDLTASAGAASSGGGGRDD